MNITKNKYKKNRKYLLIIIAILFLSLIINKNVNAAVAVTKVELSKKTMVIQPGKIGTFKATITPSNATNQNVTWSSTNSDIVSVDENGKIRTISAGTATITATSESNPNVSGSCTIMVKDTVVDVTDVSFGKKYIKLNYGDTYNLKPTISPSNADDKKIIYVSRNPKAVSVDENGKVKVIMNKNGKVAIIAKSNANNNIKDTIYISTRGKVKNLGTISDVSIIKTVNGETIKGKPNVKKETAHIGQGFCVAHVDPDKGLLYMFTAFRDASEKRSLIQVIKRTSSDVKIINSFYKTKGELGHANGMTYYSKYGVVYIAGINSSNPYFKYFTLNGSFEGNVNLKSSFFKNSSNKKTYAGAVAYDEKKERFYIASGCTLRTTDITRTIEKSTIKVDGSYPNSKDKDGNIKYDEDTGEAKYTCSSGAQDIGGYNGKILVVRHNKGVTDSKSTVAKPLNAIDIYDGETLEYLGTNIIKLGDDMELESVDYYLNGYFAIFYYKKQSGVGYIGKIKLSGV